MTAGAMEPPTHMSEGVERAWRRWLEALEWARRFIYTREFCDRTEVREQANHYLMQVQAAAYSWVMAPRVDYPRFYLGLFEPMVWNWALPSPDFRYRWAFVDGAQTYRIWGKRGDARFLDLQLLPSMGSVEKDAFRKLPTAAYPLDKMHLEADGSFEIVASPEPHDGNWIKLDPAQAGMTLFLREAFYDWANDRPSLLRIERVGSTPPRPMRWDDAEMIKRIEQAARFVEYVVEDWGVAGFERTLKVQDGVRNIFIWPNPPSNSGTNPAAHNTNMIYDIGPDEALIIESDKPTSRYWSFCIGDRYLQLADFTYHQSSLNGHQARIDADGKFRAVLTQQDPGVPNWLDPVEIAPMGLIQFRQFFQEKPVDPPRVTKVAFSDIRRHLPADTPLVSPAERAQQLRDRAWAVLGLYGY
ncbi:MAG: hypothetical protein JWQ29_2900 [Phenylobacterium sp.]|nr:hypothetical protein [Phenylobacterium sp.]